MNESIFLGNCGVFYTILVSLSCLQAFQKSTFGQTNTIICIELTRLVRSCSIRLIDIQITPTVMSIIPHYWSLCLWDYNPHIINLLKNPAVSSVIWCCCLRLIFAAASFLITTEKVSTIESKEGSVAICHNIRVKRAVECISFFVKLHEAFSAAGLSDCCLLLHLSAFSLVFIKGNAAQSDWD